MLVDLRFRFSKCVIEIKCHDTQSCVHLLPSVRIQAIYRLGYFFIAYDTERTVAEARALWWPVDRPNLFVKIPAARQGLAAITACLAEGISINVTLIFSLARYDEVIEAFLTGLEGARAAGRDLSGIASVASFFVSRVDTDRRLDKIGTSRAAVRQGRDRQRAAGLPALRASRVHATVDVAGAGRGPAAAPAVDLYQRQGSRLRRHPLCDSPGRTGASSTLCPRPPSTRSLTTGGSRMTASTVPTTGRRKYSANSPCSASTTTTWCRCGKTRG